MHLTDSYLVGSQHAILISYPFSSVANRHLVYIVRVEPCIVLLGLWLVLWL